MYFTKAILASAISTLALFTSVANTAPVEIRDVYVPPILYPNAETVWKVGQRHNVTWDISNPPRQITNKFGTIYVRKNDLTDVDHPLASDFDILLGRYEITVPNVPGEVQLVLMGDSGNFSPKFTIKH
ncbi:hypothetical protein ONZ45_g13691 [Pleurotus djamor]|nr:hypothetical protein ONZ45_g13691 [Pleurotus djamor]